jgi:DNA-binding transcriptional LysR family regulator
MCTLSPAMLADFIVSFRQGYPGVDLNVTDGAAKQVLQQLVAGEREVAVLGHADAIDERFHALPLYRERYVAVLPNEHRLANQKEVHAVELDNEPYVSRINCELAEFADPEFAKLGVTIKVVFKSERDDWVLGMIRSGMGWGFFPENFAFPTDVAVRPLMSPEFDRTVSLVTVRGRPHSPAVGAFVKAARSFAWPNARGDAVRSAA